GVFVAGLTAFYSWRLAFFTFNGHARWTSEDLEHHWHNRDHADHAHGHASDHASAAQAETHDEPLGNPADHGHGHGHHGPAHAPEWVVWAPLVVSVAGLLIAAYVYLMREGLGARMAARGGPLYTFFYNKWFFDELYEATFVRAAKVLGDLFWKGGDQKIID